MLKVTLVKSTIGNVPKNRRTVAALGLRKIGSTNTFEDTPAIRGMIHAVKYLLQVEEVQEGQITRRRRDGKALAEKRAAKNETVVAEPKKNALSTASTKSVEPKAPKAPKASKAKTDDHTEAKAAKPKAPKAKAEAANDEQPKKTTRKKKTEDAE